MSILVEPLNMDFFLQVPQFEDALETFQRLDADKQINLVGELFVKHGCYKEFGLTIVHRHFDMARDEVLVESMDEGESMSVSIPWKLENGSDNASPSDPAYWNSFNFLPKDFILPKSWAFNSSGELVAFEYVLADEKFTPPNPQFATELYGLLRQMGLDGIIGLRKLQGIGNSYERTPEGIRANIVKFEDAPNDMKGVLVSVVWSFNEHGKMKPVQDCAHYCSHNFC
ncbi:uncharacterized protein LOC110860782 isoform X2 [Folsomia candida]|uniref:Uncharacterized protein n=2 Tax=Folsomia candida TaxID=158441 RepID=A0A226D531_FOLCA|nr:uncharacterized protein LOC110860782 isoform X2 [Folsomia candida]OXA40180.1 hypothetical protein Fcan01_25028 [Folsomia candida]